MVSIKLAKIFFFLITITIAFQFLYAQTVNIKIIETSDVHGALLPYDLTNDVQTTSSLGQVHSYVVSQRMRPDQEVILLDNGDLIQGDPMSYFYNFEDTSGTHIFADALNFMGYDAATIGNHDIETGHDVYDRFAREINFPWLTANAINKETDEPYFQPYTIIERKGVRIAVLGLTTPSVPNWLPEKLWSGIVFEDMIESAEKWVEIIKEKENPDILIGLFHSGVDYTYNGEEEDTYKNENASQLVAERVPGFDVVFVGHDHAGWNFKIENDAGDSVLILGPLSRARTIAVADINLEFDNSSSKWNKKSVSGDIVETKDYKPDDHFMSKFLLNLNIVKNYVQKPLGQISKSISSKESMFGPSEFTDLIHKAQLEMTGADISFTSPLSFNTTIDSGWLYVKDMFKLYHYENFLYTMELSGQEIKDYLEYSYGNWFNQMNDENDHLIKFSKDENGEIKFSSRYNTPETEERFYNYSSAAGINYTVDVSKHVGERINISSMTNGSEFDYEKNYIVAIHSYRGSGGGGHLTKGAGIPKEKLAERILTSTDKDLRYHLMKWIEEKKVVNPEIISSWKVIPEDWYEWGREKDYELLFGVSAPKPEANSTESDYK
jgi:2',3'-cyclic-nucleotide 2'-phosphodiesterase / 3'-nucleotidase